MPTIYKKMFEQMGCKCCTLVVKAFSKKVEFYYLLAFTTSDKVYYFSKSHNHGPTITVFP